MDKTDIVSDRVSPLIRKVNLPRRVVFLNVRLTCWSFRVSSDTKEIQVVGFDAAYHDANTTFEVLSLDVPPPCDYVSPICVLTNRGWIKLEIGDSMFEYAEKINSLIADAHHRAKKSIVVSNIKPADVQCMLCK